MSGPNDQAMAETTNPVSNGVNWVVNQGMDLLGYNTRRRDPSQDNPFYRDNAQYMPGWSMPGSGLPSGAYAQDRATNYVGHPGADPDSNQTWQNVRESLVSQEGARIQQRQAAGESGRLSFGDLYNAHVNAYDNSNRDTQTGQVNSSQGGRNGFIDPASFALAIYGAPALEAVGINSGPITGTSIDMFNDPTDSATAGWAKRMALSGGEMGAGALAMATGHPLIGAGLMGLGAFSGAWNTATALRHGMLGEIGGGIANGARSLWNGAGNLAARAGGAISSGLGAAGGAISNGLGAAGRGISNVVSGAGSMLSSGASAVGSGLSTVGRGVTNAVSSAGSAISNGASAVGRGVGNAASRAGGAISRGFHSIFG